jgi:hypothetical protein
VPRFGETDWEERQYWKGIICYVICNGVGGFREEDGGKFGCGGACGVKSFHVAFFPFSLLFLPHDERHIRSRHNERSSKTVFMNGGYAAAIFWFLFCRFGR